MKVYSELLEPLSNVAQRPVDWLWPGRLARGKLSIFDGDPSQGKSLITLDLCARLTTGRPLPGGASPSPPTPPANVIVFNGEDGAADTIAPRLRALAADLSRVFIIRHDCQAFRLPTHLDRLDRALTETKAVFVVLDPIMAFLDPAINTVSDMSVRRALSPLARLAEDHGCHVTMVRHLNKRHAGRSLYRGGGSIGLVAACRSAFLFGRDPTAPERFIMAQTKNNLAPPQPSLAYRIDAQEAGPPRLDWLGPSPLSADQLVAADTRPGRPSRIDAAIDFLTALLDDGPRCTLDIWKAAKERGIHRRALQRIRSKLGIGTRTVWSRDRTLTYWLLPGQRLPTDLVAAAPDVPSLEPWLAPIREQYPPDPLEDNP